MRCPHQPHRADDRDRCRGRVRRRCYAGRSASAWSSWSCAGCRSIPSTSAARRRGRRSTAWCSSSPRGRARRGARVRRTGGCVVRGRPFRASSSVTPATVGGRGRGRRRWWSLRSSWSSSRWSSSAVVPQPPQGTSVAPSRLRSKRAPLMCAAMSAAQNASLDPYSALNTALFACGEHRLTYRTRCTGCTARRAPNRRTARAARSDRRRSSTRPTSPDCARCSRSTRCRPADPPQ